MRSQKEPFVLLTRKAGVFLRVCWYVVMLGQLCPGSFALGAPPFSDFEDGTLQGWTIVNPSRGRLTLGSPGFGNSGYAMDFYDDGGSGTGLDEVEARAPALFSGDLSGFYGIQWNEFAEDHFPAFRSGPGLRLYGVDGTGYAFAPRPPPPGVGGWGSRFLSFAPANYVRITGSASFDSVLHNVQSLVISGETSALENGDLEIRLDNIGLVPVPEPSTLALVSLGILFIVVARMKVKRANCNVHPGPGVEGP